MDCHHHCDPGHCLDVTFSSMVQTKLHLLCDYKNLAIPHPRCHSLHISSPSECCSVQKTETFERIWSIQAGWWSIEKINCEGSSFNVDCNHFCHKPMYCLVTTTFWCKIHTYLGTDNLCHPNYRSLNGNQGCMHWNLVKNEELSPLLE